MEFGIWLVLTYISQSHAFMYTPNIHLLLEINMYLTYLA